MKEEKLTIKFKEGIAKSEFGELRFTDFELTEGIPVVWGKFKTRGYYRYGYKRAGVSDVLRAWFICMCMNLKKTIRQAVKEPAKKRK